jgi:hypothetical protein
MNYRQIKAIEQKNKEKLISHFGNIPNTSGIYVLRRFDNGFKYAYIGQAKHLLTRLAQHLSGFQHIDISLKKHGLYSEENKTGWDITAFELNENLLDGHEQYYIKLYAGWGYQLYNHTTGSQGAGKKALGDPKERKGYNQGLHNGYIKAIKEVRNYFDKYLDFVIKGKTNKTKERKFEEFKRWVYEETNKGDC